MFLAGAPHPVQGAFDEKRRDQVLIAALWSTR